MSKGSSVFLALDIIYIYIFLNLNPGIRSFIFEIKLARSGLCLPSHTYILFVISFIKPAQEQC